MNFVFECLLLLLLVIVFFFFASFGWHMAERLHNWFVARKKPKA